MLAPTIINADCVDAMAAMDADSVDAIVCDPPYELGFMGKAWDGSGIAYRVAMWAAVLRVLKPGGHLLAFGGTRTYHRMACAIEDAGFEIRDQLQWLYASGFPKSHNLHGEHEGWGTALKPANEPIVLARKPLSEPTVAANVLRWGTGALNIDAGRVRSGEQWAGDGAPTVAMNGYGPGDADGWSGTWDKRRGSHISGRWPANVILSHSLFCMPDGCAPDCPVAMLDVQSGARRSGGRVNGSEPSLSAPNGIYDDRARVPFQPHDDTGGASRFFYVAKASRRERNAGLETNPERPLLWSSGTLNPGSFQSPNTHRAAANNHPTVKPIALMRYLCRLVTPPGGVVLDPFLGSGTTLIAAALDGFRGIGIERDAEYCAIARGRLGALDLELVAD